jgi:hypothetical protein
MMVTFMDKESRRLIKRLHTLYGKTGMSPEDRKSFLSAWGVEHTNELTATQMMEACQKLDMLLNPALQEQDRWRKRVMASVGGWLRSTGQQENGKYIKAIACRAAGKTDFNQIPVAMLRNLYYEFKDKQKARERVNTIDAAMLLSVIGQN